MPRKKKVEVDEYGVLKPDEESEFELKEDKNAEKLEEAQVLESPKEDPRYTILKDALKALVDESPSLEKVQQNPWLFLEWRNRVAQLVT